MKLRIPRRRARASVLLWAIVASVVIIAGGYSIYHMRRWMRRLDGIQDRRLNLSNDTAVVSPPGTSVSSVSVTVKSLKVIDLDIPYYPPSFAAPPEPLRRFVVIHLDSAGQLSLSIVSAADWERHDLLEWFGLDQYGVPENSAWSGEPSIAGATRVELLRSTNCLHWAPVATLQVRPNEPTFYEDLWPETAFYRARH